MDMKLNASIDLLILFKIFGSNLPTGIFKIKTEIDKIIIPILFNNNIRLNNNECKL